MLRILTILLIAVLAILLLFFVFKGGYSDPNIESVVNDRVLALDYDTLTDTVYYIGSDSSIASPLAEDYFIKSFNLNSGNEFVLADNLPRFSMPWIGIGKNEEIYVFDASQDQSSVTVYEDGQKNIEYAVEYLDKDQCASLIQGSDNSYLGITDAESEWNPGNVPGLEKDFTENVYYPRFIVPKINEEVVYNVRDCDKEMFRGGLEEYLDNNLQNVNKSLFLDSSLDDDFLWVSKEHDFRFKENNKFFGFLQNQPCERVFDMVGLGSDSYNMDFCIRGIHLFPSSGNFFTKDGDLMYVSLNGVYILKKS